MFRVGIIDLQDSTRLGLSVACANKGHHVIAQSVNVAEFVAFLKASGQHVDVIVFDLFLSKESLVQKHIEELHTVGTSILAYVTPSQTEMTRLALVAGVKGVIPKVASVESIVGALETIFQGESLNNLEWASILKTDSRLMHAQLGPREKEVLYLYASGMSLKNVADRLGIAHSTAREYLYRIRDKYTKVGRPSRTKVDLLRRALEDGILPGVEKD